LDFYQVPTPEAPYDTVIVEGLIVCHSGWNLEIEKTGDLERTAAERVAMRLYRYNAWEPGAHNILRYDNQHLGDEDTYHNYVFDPDT
jgi:hypothetical protein